MNRSKTEVRLTSNDDVVRALIAHEDFFRVAAGDVKAFESWLGKNREFELPIKLLNRLMRQRFDSDESFIEFIHAIESGKKGLTRYLVENPELLSMFKAYLGPVISAAVKWKTDQIEQNQDQGEELDTLFEQSRSLGENRVRVENERNVAVKNIIALRKIVPSNKEVNFDDFKHLFFSEPMPEKLSNEVKIFYDLVNDRKIKDTVELELRLKTLFLLYPNLARIASEMTFNRNELEVRLRLLLDIKTTLDNNPDIIFAVPSDRAGYLSTVIIPKRLNSLDSYIAVNSASTIYNEISSRQLNELNLLKKILKDPVVRNALGEDRSVSLDKMIADIPNDNQSADNAMKIIRAYNEVFNLCKIETYPMVQDVLKMVAFMNVLLRMNQLSKDDGNVMKNYEFIDENFRIENLNDLVYVHQLYNVLSETETMKTLLKFQREITVLDEYLENQVDEKKNTQPSNELRHIIESWNDYESIFVITESCYENLLEYIESTIKNKNDIILEQLVKLSLDYPMGLRLENFRYSELPRHEIESHLEKLNYCLALIRNDLFDESDYKALFNVKTSHQSLLEKLTTPQGSELAYFIQKIDINPNESNLLELLKEAVRKSSIPQAGLIFKASVDKNIEQYVHDLKASGRFDEAERFLRKVDEIDPSNRQLVESYNTDPALKDLQGEKAQAVEKSANSMPIQSYTNARSLKDASPTSVDKHSAKTDTVSNSEGTENKRQLK